ncbi:hypothetical protein D3C86_1180270 [compost metagenome]
MEPPIWALAILLMVIGLASSRPYMSTVLLDALVKALGPGAVMMPMLANWAVVSSWKQ